MSSMIGTAGALVPHCHGPAWRDQDLSRCLREEYLNWLAPLLALAISITVLAAQKATDEQRKVVSATQVARLNPEASNIALPSPRAYRHGLLSRVMTAVMPLNGSRLADRLQRRSRRGDSYGSAHVSNDAATPSNAAMKVFRTENAVIFNEVHRVLSDRLDDGSSERRLLSFEGTEKLKRAWEAIGSVTALGISLSGITSHDKTCWAWIAMWTYLSLLSLWTLTHRTSLFKHKAFMLAIALLIALWNLRSTLLNSNRTRFEIIQSASYAIVCAVTFLPTMAFPYESRLPLPLRAIQNTINAETLHGEAATAIPTPRHHSPPASTNGDMDAFEGTDQAKEMGCLIASPENHASLLSRALFDFVTPAMIKHYRVQFTLDAVPDLPPGNHAASVVATYRSQDENNTKGIAGMEGVEHEDGYGGNESASEDSPLLSEDHVNGGLPAPRRSLRYRLIRHFAPLIALQMFWASIEAFASLSSPLAMRLILGYIAERSRGDRHTPLHMAVMFALVLLIGGTLDSISSSQALFTGRKICIRARAILVFEIVNKALRRRDTGGAAKDEDQKENKGQEHNRQEDSKRTSDGEVTNLVAVDVFRVSEIGAYLHFIFPLSPIQIILCLYFLIKLLGVSALAGLVMIVVAIPLQTLAARVFTIMQKRLLERTDQRLNLASEVLNCIKTVKFFAWEKPFEERMNETREKELKALKNRFIAWVGSYLLYLSLPTCVTLLTFAVHTVVLHRPLPAETAFTALALFNSLRNPLDALPDMLVNVLSAVVSLRRIDKFLREEETGKYDQLMPNAFDSAYAPSSSVIGFSRATFTYSENDQEIDGGHAFCLRDLDVKFPRGELSIIAGSVGSGKTTMLLSLLGETRRLAGRTYMPCAVARTLVPVDQTTGLSETIAYCPQSPWLLGATVKENILFGQSYNEERYRAVVRACALEPDLDILEYNDETEVGEKGTALSGGQKARVALARAIYSPARYVLLDDVLSAVDAHTAKHLYRHCLKGALVRGRTVILVTHAVSLCLPGAAMAVALKDGYVVAAGTPAEVQMQGAFDDETTPSGTQTPQRDSPSSSREHKDDVEDVTVEELDDEARATKHAEMKVKREKKALHANIETYGKGNVGFKAYKLYICSFATTFSGLITFWVLWGSSFGASRLTDVLNASWLRRWASTYEHPDEGQDMDERDRRTRFYLTVYGLLALTYVLCTVGREILALYGSLRASRLIHRRLLGTLLQAKPQWFDRTPIGRIMNRLSKDVETIDQDITMSLMFFVDVCLQSVIIMLVACYSLPIFTVFAVVIVILYWLIGALYIVSSRDLKRLESVTRSPIFTLVGEVLSGAVVIRAYGDASRFTRHCLRLIDKTNRPFYLLWCENRWLSVRVDGLAVITSFAVAMFLIVDERVDAAMAGFTLSFTIQLVNAVLWVMRMYTQLEISANSVERVEEYLHLEPERFGQGQQPPEGWPSKQGAVEVQNLSVRYSTELPMVLRNVSFRVEAGEKIGICGRTGSGKSSLALALFRFLEAETGRIIVDGLDLSSVALEEIRKRLTIIPQEAQLFSGSVRFNLDPFGTFDDEVLWDVLERCKLTQSRRFAASSSQASQGNAKKKANNGDASDEANNTQTQDEEQRTAVITSLDMPVEQGGKNFSAGQRQLLALARGLLKLRNSNIVLLDESTASLDANSDAAVQRTIRSEMRDATMLVVAHRIRGIVTFDKVLVLDVGQLVEFDKPSTLLRREGSAFRELCQRSGEFDLLVQMADGADRERLAGNL